MAVRTSSSESPIEASATGLTRTRIAGCSAPLTVDLGHAIDLRQTLDDHGVGGIVERAGRHGVRGQRQDHDRRRRRIGFAERRPRRQVGRQIGLRRVDGGLHVARGAVDIAVEIELHRDAGGAERAARGQLGDPRDFAEPAFERRRDRRRHGLGVGARPAGGDADGREVHRRHAGDRQEAIRHDADEQQADGQQRGADRSADEGLGEVRQAHAATPPAVAKVRADRGGRARSAPAAGG